MVTRYESDLDAETHLAVLRAATETLSESVMITDAREGVSDPKIVYVNPAFTRLTGYGMDEAVGRTPKFLQGYKTERKVLDRLKVELNSRQQWKGSTYNYTKAGQPFLMEWEIVPIHDTTGQLRYYLTVQRRKGEERTIANKRRVDALRRWTTV